jgi:CelD/BcsL family acetyltransferase involved in cellulose biosynthesis
MRGTPCADVGTVGSLDALVGEADRLFDGAEGIFATRAWWRTVLGHAMPAGAEASFVVCRSGGEATGLFPMLRDSDGGLRGLTTPYTCLYAPLLASGADVAAVFAAFGRFCAPHGVVRLDAMAAEWPHWDAALRGLREAGLRARQFDHFGNWYEDVAGLGWDGYLASRAGALRETVRRRLRRAERLADARFLVIAGGDGLDAGIAAFEAVYAKSWKEPEPFPTFNAALIAAAAEAGSLRLGSWAIGETVVASQFWIVEDGCATVLKLAHDEAFKAHSPGTVLTALMLRHLLDQDRVARIDFGRGDDPYKRDWARQRRQRLGVLIAAPWRVRGLLALARHDAGRLRAWVRSFQAA